MLRTTKLACTLLPLAILACCGGAPVTPLPPPPGPDFNVSASPVSASAVLGNSTSAVTISVVSEHGFNNSVDFSFQGLPQGVDAAPALLLPNSRHKSVRYVLSFAVRCGGHVSPHSACHKRQCQLQEVAGGQR
jgi:hypothetical protein